MNIISEADDATAEFAEQWSALLDKLGPPSIEAAVVALRNLTAMFSLIAQVAESDPSRATVMFESLAAIGTALPVALTSAADRS